jgi:hypothetical protein
MDRATARATALQRFDYGHMVDAYKHLYRSVAAARG